MVVIALAGVPVIVAAVIPARVRVFVPEGIGCHRLGPPLAGQLPDGNPPDDRHQQNRNPAAEDPREKHWHQDVREELVPLVVHHEVHQDRDEADGPGRQDREELVEEECPFPFAVRVFVSHVEPPYRVAVIGDGWMTGHR